MTSRLTLFLFVAILLCRPLVAQEAQVPPLEEEAPEAIFDQKIGDVGVELVADGTWTTRLVGGWGLGLSPEGVLPGLGYPGWEKGGIFSQEPDFSLTLRLIERYYLEVAYHGTAEDRTFLVGYDGQPGEPVQWVKVGNASFSVPTRAGQTLAEGRSGAPAAGAAFSLGPVSLEALGRYEEGTRETKSFRGFREVSASTVALDTWIRNRFFRLPGTAPFQGVRVLVADPSGDLGGYRTATATEAAVDSATGEIRLPAEATRKFLVTWSGAAGWPNTPSAILGLTAVADTAPGTGTWFVLAQPGSASRFEQRNRYPVAKDTVGSILLYDNDQTTVVAGYSVSQSTAQDWFEVSGDPEAPFYSRVPGIYPGTGMAAPPVNAATLPWSFRLPLTVSATSFALGEEVVPSSLVVVRNGLATVAYKFDAEAGTLKLDVPVFDTDLIEVSFQRKKGSGKASDLVLWQGGRWDLSEGNHLEWNLQGRWNMEQGRYTTEDLQSPGRIAGSLAWTGAGGEWSWFVSATGGALLADSTGHRQIYGNTTAGTEASLDGDALRPSAAPGRTGGLTASLTDTNRATTFFRNYWTNDPLTGKPEAGIWGKPGVNREPGGADGWMGPYMVRGDGDRNDRLVVAEADLEPGEWTGLQVFLDQGKARDLRSTSAVSAVVRLVGGKSGDRLILQAGTLAENFDGTAAVREVVYRSLPALPFLDRHQGVKLFFPIPEDSRWGNDADKDGAAGEDGDLVSRELNPTFDPTKETWQSVRLLLTPNERQRLERTTGWRLVLVEGGGSGSRTLLAGPVTFEGSTWSVLPDSTATGSVNLVEESSPSKTDGHHLRVDWSSRSSWTIEGRHSPVRPASYRTLKFRYRLVPGSGDANLSLKLADSDDKGVTIAWTAVGSTDWVEAVVDLRSKVLTLDGVPAGKVTLGAGQTSWDRMTITQQGAVAGTWYLAEVEAVDPVWEPLGTSMAKATWRQQGSWPSAQLPLVSGLTLGMTSTQAGLSSQDLSWRGQTTLAGTLGPLRASGEADFTQTATEKTAHGAYEATLPLGWAGGPRLEWTDQFSDRGLRAERLILGLPWVGTLTAQAKAEGPPTTLDQEYKASWSSATEWPEGWKAALSAQWNQNWAWDQPLADFSRQWVDSWDWLRPPAGIAPYHMLQAQEDTKATWGPAALETQVILRTSQSVGPVVKWSPFSSWTVRNPWKFDVPNWSLTPSVAQKTDTVYQWSQALAPRESAQAYLAWLQGPDHGADTSVESTSYSLEAGREPGSEWMDLVLPSQGGTKLILTRGFEKSAGYQATQVNLNLQARGLNLFGSLGGTPIFPWYRTDTWTWSTTGSWGTGTRPQDKVADAAVATRTELVITTEESLSLPVTYQGKWGATESQQLGVKPTWTLRQPAVLPFEIPRWLSPSAFRRMWVQDLALSLDFGWQPTPAPVLRDLQVSWKGHLLLSENSELAFTTRWGQQWQTDLVVIGLEAAVDLVLSF